MEHFGQCLWGRNVQGGNEKRHGSRIGKSGGCAGCAGCSSNNAISGEDGASATPYTAKSASSTPLAFEVEANAVGSTTPDDDEPSASLTVSSLSLSPSLELPCVAILPIDRKDGAGDDVAAEAPAAVDAVCTVEASIDGADCDAPNSCSRGVRGPKSASCIGKDPSTAGGTASGGKSNTGTSEPASVLESRAASVGVHANGDDDVAAVGEIVEVEAAARAARAAGAAAETEAEAEAEAGASTSAAGCEQRRFDFRRTGAAGTPGFPSERCCRLRRHTRRGR